MAASSPQPASIALIGAWQRRFLYLTAAITGGAIMIVEILGAKMLAPYFGTSHFVWTAQIAVTLVALASGYYAGGRLVDRSLRLGPLYACVLGAGGWLALAAPSCETVADACMDLGLALGSLLASAFLFFFPLGLLAMTGPYVVRILTSSLSDVGSNVGRLTAVSTLGSFAGTILIGYVMIPYLPNSWTMYGTALTLTCVASIHFLAWGRERRAAVTALLAAVSACASGYGLLADEHWTSWRTKEVFRGNSSFGVLQVLDDQSSGQRMLFTDFLLQNTYDMQRKQSTAMFSFMLHGLARAYTPRIDDMLCIGLGIGVVPTLLAREGVAVDVVEINPAIAPVAQKYFDLDPAVVTLSVDDGRHFVNRSRKRYDVVMLDAFLGDSAPSHLMTREAFSAMRRILRPDGVLLINAFGYFAPGKDFLVASLHKTLAQVFPSVRIHAADSGNTMFVASLRAKLEMLHAPVLDDVHPAAFSAVHEAFAQLRTVSPTSGRVLTDDYNPVEFYDARNREGLRKSAVAWLRR